MKKNILSATLIILVIAMLTGCTVAIVDENKISVTVTSCTENEFHPHTAYQAMALAALEKQSATLYKYYSKLAQAHGTYDYIITFEVDGVTYSVLRNESYEVGSEIMVTQVVTRTSDTIHEIEYR